MKAIKINIPHSLSIDSLLAGQPKILQSELQKVGINLYNLGTPIHYPAEGEAYDSVETKFHATISEEEMPKLLEYLEAEGYDDSELKDIRVIDIPDFQIPKEKTGFVEILERLFNEPFTPDSPKTYIAFLTEFFVRSDYTFQATSVTGKKEKCIMSHTNPYGYGLLEVQELVMYSHMYGILLGIKNTLDISARFDNYVQEAIKIQLISDRKNLHI